MASPFKGAMIVPRRRCDFEMVTLCMGGWMMDDGWMDVQWM